MIKKRLIIISGLVLSLLWLTGCQSDQSSPKPNVLLICVDDLRPELNSFGATHIFSPNIDRLAEKGVSFQRHFVNAPSCGPSRYTLLTGQYGPAGNNALFQRADDIRNPGRVVSSSMPEWFRKRGYTTVSVGKVSHHPGGRGGKNWNDSTIVEMPRAWSKALMPVAEWQHPRGMMHGLAHGEIRLNAEDMDVFQSAKGDDRIYPDGIIADVALKQLNELAKDKKNPFFLAVGIIKPHLPFGAPNSYLEKYQGIDFPAIEHPVKPEGKTTWHGSGEFMKYNRWGKDPNTDAIFAEEVRHHYAACVSYADAQVGKILDELEKTGADKNTIVVLWGDHGWHLGEHAIWGKHSLFEESLHSPLVISYPGMKNKGGKTEAIVETVDIFPTLCELTGLEIPNFVQGVSLIKNIKDPESTGHLAIGYQKKAKTIRSASHRLTVHANGNNELYDHNSPEKETKNIADKHPQLIEDLKNSMEEKLK